MDKDKLTIGSISDYFFSGNIGLSDIEEVIGHFINNLNDLHNQTDITEIKTDINYVIKVLETHSRETKFVDGFTYNMTGSRNHATFQLVQRKGASNYHHYYFNSGGGIGSKNTSGELIHQFKPSSIGIVNPILEFIDKKYRPLSEENTVGMEEVYKHSLKKYQQKTDFFLLEMQLQGNCAMRSIIYPIYLILKLKFEKEDAYLIYLINLIKLFIIKNNINNIFPDKLNYDDVISLNFFKDLINNSYQNKFNSLDNEYQKQIQLYYDEVLQKLDSIEKIGLSNSNNSSLIEVEPFYNKQYQHNLRDIDIENPWVKHKEELKKYNDSVHLKQDTIDTEISKINTENDYIFIESLSETFYKIYNILTAGNGLSPENFDGNISELAMINYRYFQIFKKFISGFQPFDYYKMNSQNIISPLINYKCKIIDKESFLFFAGLNDFFKDNYFLPYLCEILEGVGDRFKLSPHRIEFFIGVDEHPETWIQNFIDDIGPKYERYHTSYQKIKDGIPMPYPILQNGKKSFLDPDNDKVKDGSYNENKFMRKFLAYMEFSPELIETYIDVNNMLNRTGITIENANNIYNFIADVKNFLNTLRPIYPEDEAFMCQYFGFEKKHFFHKDGVVKNQINSQLAGIYNILHAHLTHGRNYDSKTLEELLDMFDEKLHNDSFPQRNRNILTRGLTGSRKTFIINNYKEDSLGGDSCMYILSRRLNRICLAYFFFRIQLKLRDDSLNDLKTFFTNKHQYLHVRLHGCINSIFEENNIFVHYKQDNFQISKIDKKYKKMEKINFKPDITKEFPLLFKDVDDRFFTFPNNEIGTYIQKWRDFQKKIKSTIKAKLKDDKEYSLLSPFVRFYRKFSNLEESDLKIDDFINDFFQINIFPQNDNEDSNFFLGISEKDSKIIPLSKEDKIEYIDKERIDINIKYNLTPVGISKFFMIFELSNIILNMNKCVNKIRVDPTQKDKYQTIWFNGFLIILLKCYWELPDDIKKELESVSSLDHESESFYTENINCIKSIFSILKNPDYEIQKLLTTMKPNTDIKYIDLLIKLINLIVIDKSTNKSNIRKISANKKTVRDLRNSDSLLDPVLQKIIIKFKDINDNSVLIKDSQTGYFTLQFGENKIDYDDAEVLLYLGEQQIIIDKTLNYLPYIFLSITGSREGSGKDDSYRCIPIYENSLPELTLDRDLKLQMEVRSINYKIDRYDQVDIYFKNLNTDDYKKYFFYGYDHRVIIIIQPVNNFKPYIFKTKMEYLDNQAGFIENNPSKFIWENPSLTSIKWEIYENSWIELEFFDTYKLFYKKRNDNNIHLIPSYIKTGERPDLNSSFAKYYFKYDDIKYFNTIDDEFKKYDFVGKVLSIPFSKDNKIILSKLVKNDKSKFELMYILFNLYFSANYKFMMDVFVFVFNNFNRFKEYIIEIKFFSILSAFFTSYDYIDDPDYFKKIFPLINALPNKYKKLISLNNFTNSNNEFKIDNRSKIPTSNRPTFVNIDIESIKKLQIIPNEDMFDVEKQNKYQVIGDFKWDDDNSPLEGINRWIEKYKKTPFIKQDGQTRLPLLRQRSDQRSSTPIREIDTSSDYITLLEEKIEELEGILVPPDEMVGEFLTDKNKIYSFNGKIFNYKKYIESKNREDNFGYFTNDQIQTIYLLIKSRINLLKNLQTIDISEIKRHQDAFELPGYCYDDDNILEPTIIEEVTSISKGHSGSATTEEVKTRISINSLYVTFEYLSGMMIRQPQYETLKAMFGNMCDNIPYHKIYQLIMGAGKSSVITPLACLILNSYDYIPITICPSHLLGDMEKSLSVLSQFGMSIDSTSLKINRGDDLYSFNLEDIITKNKVFIASDTFLKTYQLMLVENELYNRMEYERSIWNRTFFLFDEVDDISDPFKCELIYPFGKIVNTNFKKIRMDDILGIYYSLVEVYFLGRKESEIIWEGKPGTIEYKIRNQFQDTTLWNQFQERSHFNIKNINDLISKTFELTKENIIVYQLIMHVLPSCLNMKYQLKYGLGLEEDVKYPILNKLAIPYSRFNTPSKGSEFSDSRITIILTLLSYLFSGILREKDYNEMISEYSMKANSIDPNEWESSTDKRNFDNLIISDNRTPVFPLPSYKLDSFVEVQKYDKNVEKFYQLKILLNKRFKHFLRFYDQKLSVSFCDIISSNFNKNRSGFSGTPYFDLPEDYNNTKIMVKKPVIKQEDEGQISFSVYNPEFGKRFESEINLDDPKYIEKFISELRSYDVLIDVGSFLSSIGINEFIIQFESIHQNKKVCYWDDNDEIVKLPKKEEETYFYLFDQKHTVGTDINLDPTSKGLVTISSRNGLRDVAQGAYRLRKIFYGQTVDYFCNFSIDGEEDNNIKLLKYLKNKENDTEKRKLKLQNLQNIRTLAREHFIQRGYQSLQYKNNSIYSNSWYNILTNIPFPLTEDELDKKNKQYVLESVVELQKYLISQNYDSQKLGRIQLEIVEDDTPQEQEQLQEQQNIQTSISTQMNTNLNTSKITYPSFTKKPTQTFYNSIENKKIKEFAHREVIGDLRIFKSTIVSNLFYNKIQSKTSLEEIKEYPVIFNLNENIYILSGLEAMVFLSTEIKDEIVGVEETKQSDINTIDKPDIKPIDKHYIKPILYKLLLLESVENITKPTFLEWVDDVNRQIYEILYTNYFFIPDGTKFKFLLNNIPRSMMMVLIAKSQCCQFKMLDLIQDLNENKKVLDTPEYLNFFKLIAILKNALGYKLDLDDLTDLFNKLDINSDNLSAFVEKIKINVKKLLASKTVDIIKPIDQTNYDYEIDNMESKNVEIKEDDIDRSVERDVRDDVKDNVKITGIVFKDGEKFTEGDIVSILSPPGDDTLFKLDSEGRVTPEYLTYYMKTKKLGELDTYFNQETKKFMNVKSILYNPNVASDLMPIDFIRNDSQIITKCSIKGLTIQLTELYRNVVLIFDKITPEQIKILEINLTKKVARDISVDIIEKINNNTNYYINDLKSFKNYIFLNVYDYSKKEEKILIIYESEYNMFFNNEKDIESKIDPSFNILSINDDTIVFTNSNKQISIIYIVPTPAVYPDPGENTIKDLIGKYEELIEDYFHSISYNGINGDRIELLITKSMLIHINDRFKISAFKMDMVNWELLQVKIDEIEIDPPRLYGFLVMSESNNNQSVFMTKKLVIEPILFLQDSMRILYVFNDPEKFITWRRTAPGSHIGSIEIIGNNKVLYNQHKFHYRHGKIIEDIYSSLIIIYYDVGRLELIDSKTFEKIDVDYSWDNIIKKFDSISKYQKEIADTKLNNTINYLYLYSNILTIVEPSNTENLIKINKYKILDNGNSIIDLNSIDIVFDLTNKWSIVRTSYNTYQYIIQKGNNIYIHDDKSGSTPAKTLTNDNIQNLKDIKYIIPEIYLFLSIHNQLFIVSDNSSFYKIDLYGNENVLDFGVYKKTILILTKNSDKAVILRICKLNFDYGPDLSLYVVDTVSVYNADEDDGQHNSPLLNIIEYPIFQRVFIYTRMKLFDIKEKNTIHHLNIKNKRLTKLEIPEYSKIKNIQHSDNYLLVNIVKEPVKKLIFDLENQNLIVDKAKGTPFSTSFNDDLIDFIFLDNSTKTYYGIKKEGLIFEFGKDSEKTFDLNTIEGVNGEEIVAVEKIKDNNYVIFKLGQTDPHYLTIYFNGKNLDGEKWITDYKPILTNEGFLTVKDDNDKELIFKVNPSTEQIVLISTGIILRFFYISSKGKIIVPVYDQGTISIVDERNLTSILDEERGDSRKVELSDPRWSIIVKDISEYQFDVDSHNLYLSPVGLPKFLIQVDLNSGRFLEGMNQIPEIIEINKKLRSIIENGSTIRNYMRDETIIFSESISEQLKNEDTGVTVSYDFINYYYIYYNEKGLPELNKIEHAEEISVTRYFIIAHTVIGEDKKSLRFMAKYHSNYYTDWDSSVEIINKIQSIEFTDLTINTNNMNNIIIPKFKEIVEIDRSPNDVEKYLISIDLGRFWKRLDKYGIKNMTELKDTTVDEANILWNIGMNLTKIKSFYGNLSRIKHNFDSNEKTILPRLFKTETKYIKIFDNSTTQLLDTYKLN